MINGYDEKFASLSKHEVTIVLNNERAEFSRERENNS